MVARELSKVLFFHFILEKLLAGNCKKMSYWFLEIVAEWAAQTS